MISRFLQWGRFDPSDEVIGAQLKDTVFRAVMIVVGGIAVACYFLANVALIWEDLPKISVALLILATGSFFALRLAERTLEAAQAVWLTGLALCLILLEYLFPQTGFFWLMGLMPMLALVVSFRLSYSLPGF